MLSQPGYSYDGSTGSVADYFRYNSNGRFIPQFDVVGPYTVSGTAVSYAGSTARWKDMANESVVFADADVDDFSQYFVTDRYGETRCNIYIFFAGEASSTKSVYPHANLTYNETLGIEVSYACSPEIEIDWWGSLSSPVFARMGLFCHEFAHSKILSLPDFYGRGTANGVGPYFLMGSGNQNNYGLTPPALTTIERWMMGWLTPTELNAPGQYTLRPVSEDKAYIIHTDNPGEDFILEVRSAADANGPNVWDAKLLEQLGLSSPVLMVYHMDMSENVIYDGYVAKQFWPSWFRPQPDVRESVSYPNFYYIHECYKVVRAVPDNSNAFMYDTNYPVWCYPGSAGVTYLSSATNPEFRTWAGGHLPFAITDIAASGNNITIRLTEAAAVDITVTLNKTKMELELFGYEQLKATVSPSGAGMLVEWSSSNESVATVDGEGYVIGQSYGQAVITARAQGTDAVATCNVTVGDFPADPISVTLDRNSLQLNKGGSEQLNATVSPSRYADMEVEWSSSNSTVATVDANGLVAGVISGQAVITAKVTGTDAEATCTVTVVDPDSPANVFVDAVHQNDVWLRWQYSDNAYKGGYRVNINGGGTESSVSSSEDWAYIGKLIPGTNYSVSIRLDDSSQKQIGEMVFTTPEATDFPASVGFTPRDAEGRITLYLQDVAGKINTVKWSVNGDPLEYPRFTPTETGRCVVTAEYETADYGETITKVITVK